MRLLVGRKVGKGFLSFLHACWDQHGEGFVVDVDAE